MNYNTYIIAEIGINHEGSIKKCLEMINSAKDCGVNAVKLQTINPDANYAKNTMSYELFKTSALSEKETREAFEHAKNIGIDIFSTVGDIPTAKLIKKLKPAAWKISSSLLTHIPLIKYLSKFNEPIIISTGLAKDKEIEEVIKLLKFRSSGSYSLLHCVSNYPAKLTELNLHKITAYKKKYKVRVGYSDHSIGTLASSLAVASGAEIIEKHFTFDNKRDSYDHKISLNYNQMRKLVEKVRKIEKIMKNNIEEKKNSIAENRKKFLRVMVAQRNIKKGTKLNKSNIAIKRVVDNSNGLPPKYFEKLINRKINTDLKKDEVISLNLFSKI